MSNPTIEQRKDKNKEALLERLRKTPIVQYACGRENVSRATYYRWRKDDPEFAKATDNAIKHGSDLVNDLAEAKLLEAIKDRNMTGIIFWLKHHHPMYATKVEVTAKIKNEIEELSPEQQEVVEQALKLASLTPTNPETYDEQQSITPTTS